MEFLDPKKQRAHTIRLLVGYVFVGIAVLLATTILIYMVRGYGYKNGEVIQNGIVFVSSVPEPAQMYVNGQKVKEQTNARLTIPAGQYTFELRRDGYKKWSRAISVEGGIVQRFDYPFLVPEKLTTTTVKKYEAQPEVLLQSPDRRWLLVPRANAFGSFDMFDLDENQPEAALVQLPADLLADDPGGHKWELVEWSTDNRHVLVKHLYGDNKSEYVLIDRADPAKSVNVTSVLGTNPTTIALRDKAYDQYFIFDANAGNIFTASLKKPTPQIYLQDVLAFKSHGEDRVLFATAKDAPEGKTAIKLKEGDRTYTLKTISADKTYLLDLAEYKNAWYVIAGAQSESRTYVYKNPIAALRAKPDMPLVPVQILKTTKPTYASFSANARFMMVENGAAFSIYDAENDRGYKYDLKMPVDSAAGHATWMDGHRLSIVSGGRAVAFEFDNANTMSLQPTLAAYQPVYDREYRYVYGMTTQTVKGADGKEVTQAVMTRTALRVPADL